MRDEVQARIDAVTGGGMPPGMDPAQMMAMGGFNPQMAAAQMGMGGMDGMANPLMLQEMMMNQMALMAQMASSMGILNPAMGQFASPQSGDMLNGGMAMNTGRGGRGGGRGGRGGQAGRGRGGHMNGGDTGSFTPGDGANPPPTVVAPTPVVAGAPPSVSPSPASQARPGFVPPERPQSPTLCKFGLKCTNAVCRYSHPSPVATPESGVVLSNDPCEKGINCTDADCVKGHVSPAIKTGGATGEHPSPHNIDPEAHMNAAVENLKPATVAPPPAPCRYGAGCTRQGAGCPYSHPKAAASGNHFATSCRFGSGCTRASCPFQHPADRVLPGTFHRGLSGDAPLVAVKTPDTGSMGSQGHNKSMTFNKATPSTGSQGAKEALEAKVRELEERKRALAEKEKAAAAKKDVEGKAAAGTPIAAI
jgi:hypothetical protein